jgi:hypothetical protein
MDRRAEYLDYAGGIMALFNKVYDADGLTCDDRTLLGDVFHTYLNRLRASYGYTHRDCPAFDLVEVDMTEPPKPESRVVGALDGEGAVWMQGDGWYMRNPQTGVVRAITKLEVAQELARQMDSLPGGGA